MSHSIITTPTVGVTVRFAGYFAPSEVWRALGVQSHPYANNETGRVTDCRDSELALARRLLLTARDQLGGEATDEQVIRRAIALRYQLDLARAASSVSVSGNVRHAHEHRAPQLDRLLDEVA